MRESRYLVVENAFWETHLDVDLAHTKDFPPLNLGTNLNLWIKVKS